MNKIEEIKQLVIGYLVDDGYELDEATKDVEEAIITQEGNTIKVTYINGVFDIYEIELVKQLKFIK